MPSKFRILHLSDLHERVATPHTAPERQALIKRTGAERHRVLGDALLAALDDVLCSGPIDFVCFTGDIADWGLPEEYEAATKRVQQILQKLALPPSRFLAVPGNHDVNRSRAKDALVAARTLAKKQIEALSRWLGGESAPEGSDPDLKTAMRDRSEAFWRWVSAVRGDSELSPRDSRYLGYRYTVPDFGTHFIGLDSAWLAHDDHDRSYLVLPKGQLDILCTDDGAALTGTRIALVHHPLNDLNHNHDTYTHLADHVDLLLHGHQHHHSATEMSQGHGGSHSYLTAQKLAKFL